MFYFAVSITETSFIDTLINRLVINTKDSIYTYGPYEMKKITLMTN